MKITYIHNIGFLIFVLKNAKNFVFICTWKTFDKCKLFLKNQEDKMKTRISDIMGKSKPKQQP